MKLPNGFGSVYKKSGNRRNPWVARKTVGWDINEETKKANPIYKFIGYFPTRKEALTALTNYNADPYDLDAHGITFKEVYEKWSSKHFEDTGRSNMLGIQASYKICSELYDMKMINIKLSHLQHVVDTSGKNTPTLKKLKVTLGLMYDWCVQNEVLPSDKRDMVRYLDVSKAGNPNSVSRAPFSASEVDKLWDVQSSNPYYSVILILIYSGVRVSELLELKKENVNLNERYFDVVASKTDAGIRTVPIAKKTLPFFKYWMGQEGPTLITTPDHEPFKYRNYYDSYWKPLLKQIGMEHRPHDARHTCVSMLTAAKVDERFIQQIVGHKGQNVTRRVYTHLEIETLLNEIDKI